MSETASWAVRGRPFLLSSFTIDEISRPSLPVLSAALLLLLLLLLALSIGVGLRMMFVLSLEETVALVCFLRTVPKSPMVGVIHTKMEIFLSHETNAQPQVLSS
jgi:hypothetical protein